MDANKYLIIFKGEDVTENVEFFKIEGSIVHVKFYRNQIVYRIKNFEISIKENPSVIDIINKAVYYGDIPVYDINKVLNFGEKVKIIFNKSNSKVYDIESIRIVDNCINEWVSKNILGYWSEVSRYISAQDEPESFWKKEFDKLKFINPESILGCYVNKEPLKVTKQSIDKLIFPFKFNLRQKEALENALSGNISVIEGPPGTGKTQTILNIIANLAIMQNKSVAVVSSNNEAVKNVKDKLNKQNYDFFVAALGKKTNREEFFKNLPKYDDTNRSNEIDENELFTKIAELNKHINYLLKINIEKAKIQQKLEAFHLEKKHFEHYYSNQKVDEIKRLSFYRQTPEMIIGFLADNYFAKEKKKSKSIFY